MRCVLFILAWQLASSANILVCVNTAGSHLYFAGRAADVLAEEGHNVTLLSAGNESRVDMATGHNYTYIVHPEMIMYNSSMNDDWKELMLSLNHGKSKEMYFDLLTFKDQAKEVIRGIRLYEHPFFEDMLRNWNFDLLVLEITASMAVPLRMLRMQDVDIPVVVISPMLTITDGRAGENMPMLLNSEQNIFNDLFNCKGKPSFRERLEWLTSFFRIIPFFKRVNDFVTNARGVSFSDITASYEVKFTIGHPALSFPYMIAENQKYLGFFTTEHYKPKPLPPDIENFISNCAGKSIPVVYMSFGTFLVEPTALPYIGKIFKSLIKSDLCYLYKASNKFMTTFSLPESRFFVRQWMPQKDLLASKKLSFFFSHCGNNGRIEGIYYNVPILCLPLFADQYFNALLVRNNSFGMMITKEEIQRSSDDDDDAVMETVNKMLMKREMFVRSMARASDIVTRDPGSGRAVFLYHVTNILKYGKAKHLKNEILLEQSIVEMYNLDILGVIILLVLVVFHIFIYCSCKLCKYAFRVCSKDNKRKRD